nr:reverse transcriptase [Tanacetum cinerariifolium]GFA46844.1 reverse transcriptase [Tanacetum cinerariifolium]
MAPATRIIANSSANDEPVTRQYVEDALVQIRQMIIGLGDQNNQGARQANQFSCLAKVEFPKFNGDDVWDEFSSVINFSLLTTLLKKKSWIDYKDVIALRFGSVYDDPMALLKNAKYDKSAKEYQDIFDTLLSRVEATLEAVKKKSRPFTNQSNNIFGVSNASGTTNKLSLFPKPSTPTLGFIRKQLTQKEYEEKRSKNLCFYCDQKYVSGYKCSGQLYSLLMLADNSEEEEEFLDADDSLVDTVNEGVQLM